MKLISHRGNIHGPEPEFENTLERIDYCISKGYDVEIDLWVIDDKFFLGHDSPEHKVSFNFLRCRSKSLWIHCKNIDAFYYLCDYDFNFFWHENDEFTLTSGKFIWTYPKESYDYVLKKNQILLDFGEISKEKYESYQNLGIYGLCCDYIPNY